MSPGSLAAPLGDECCVPGGWDGAGGWTRIRIWPCVHGSNAWCSSLFKGRGRDGGITRIWSCCGPWLERQMVDFVFKEGSEVVGSFDYTFSFFFLCLCLLVVVVVVVVVCSKICGS